MDMTKPFKGNIVGGFQMHVSNKTDEHLGYIYVGNYQGRMWQTSLVVKDNCDIPRHVSDGYMIETLNSRYTIVPDEKYR